MTFHNLVLLAWRDSRGSRLRLVLFAAAFVAGIAALTAATILRGAIATTIEDEARALLGADMSIVGKQQEALTLPAGISPDATAKEIRFRSMARFTSGVTRLVQVRALEPGMPYFGTVSTTPAGVWAHFREDPTAALIDESLALQAKIEVGEQLSLGAATFIVRAIVTEMPGSANVSTAVAPRVYIAYQSAAASGLLARGSVADYYLHLKFPRNGVRGAEEFLQQNLAPQLVLETVAARAQQLGTVSDNVTLFIALAGLTILGLGGIGTATSLSFYLRSKLPDAALLKCLGLPARCVVLVYAAQLLVVALLAAEMGMLVGLSLASAAQTLIARFASVQITTAVPLENLALPFIVGILVALIAAIPGMTLIRSVPGYSLLKGDLVNYKPRVWILIGGLVYATLSGIISLLGQPLSKALIGGAGIVVILVALASLSFGAESVARWVGRRIKYFPIRHGILSIARPQNSTRALVMAFALTVAGAGTLLIAEHLLRQRINSVMFENTANLFVYDVQRDQAEGVREVLNEHQAALAEEVPIVLMRIVEIKGQPVSQILADPKSKIPDWTLKRDYWSSYRRDIATNEKITAGTWIPEVKSGTEVVPISIEDRLAARLQVELGDSLTFDIQGVPVRTTVASIRKIYWEQMRRNAFIVFPVGVLEEAPNFLFMTARAHAPQQSAAVQQALAQKFPGVSIVDLRSAVETVAGYLQQIAVALQVLVLIVLFTALTVLGTTLVTSRESRSRESLMLRALGATSVQRQTIVRTEFVALATIGAVLGLSISVGIGALLNTFFFHLDFSLPVGSLLAVSFGLIGVVGVLGAVGGAEEIMI